VAQIGPAYGQLSRVRPYGVSLTFRALRHTYASLCAAAGIPLLQISRFMGHSKVTTTLNTTAISLPTTTPRP
jgi:integrase